MALTEQQKKIFEGHKMQMALHLNAESGDTLNHRCEGLGLTRSVFTPKVYASDAARKNGYHSGYGEPEVAYFLDGDQKEYKTLSEVADAIIAKGEEVSAKSSA